MWVHLAAREPTSQDKIMLKMMKCKQHAKASSSRCGSSPYLISSHSTHLHPVTLLLQDRAIITTTDAERRVSSPESLQPAIDALVAEYGPQVREREGERKEEGGGACQRLMRVWQSAGRR